MSMQCVKTGARVMLEEYGGVAAADLYRVGSTMVAILGCDPASASMLDYSNGARARVTHLVSLGTDGYYHRSRGVIVAPMRCWTTVVPEEEAVWTATGEREKALEDARRVLREMRERHINHGKATSPTLNAWADELEAQLPVIAGLADAIEARIDAKDRGAG